MHDDEHNDCLRRKTASIIWLKGNPQSTSILFERKKNGTPGFIMGSPIREDKMYAPLTDDILQLQLTPSRQLKKS